MRDDSGFEKGVRIGFMFGMLFFASVIAVELSKIAHQLDRICGYL